MIARAFAKLRALGVHPLRVLTMPLEGLPRVRIAHPEMTYLPMTESEALAWCEVPDMQLTARKVRDSYARGDLCVGVSDQGVPVGYVWFAFGAVPHDGPSWIEFDPQVRYAYRAFIRASYRGLRISQELYTQAGEMAPRRGRSVGAIVIDVGNGVSLRASRRAGRTVAGYAIYFDWFGRVYSLRSPGARRLGVRFSRTTAAGKLASTAPA